MAFNLILNPSALVNAWVERKAPAALVHSWKGYQAGIVDAALQYEYARRERMGRIGLTWKAFSLCAVAAIVCMATQPAFQGAWYFGLVAGCFLLYGIFIGFMRPYERTDLKTVQAFLDVYNRFLNAVKKDQADDIGKMSLDDFKKASREALVSGALRVREIEIANEGVPVMHWEDLKKRAVKDFEETYLVATQLRMIENTGYKPYYDQAQAILDKRAKALTTN